MLPWEMLDIICKFCPLESRYCWMLTCKAFSKVDWQRFGSTYMLSPCSKSQLKHLMAKAYSADWCLRRHREHVWSDNLNEPLTVWSPWSTVWYMNATSATIFFRKWRFLEFVRCTGRLLNLKMSCIRKRFHEQGVRVCVWKNQRVHAMATIADSDPVVRKPRAKWEYVFKRKKTQKVRALLSFRILPDQTVRLKVKRLEFLVSK